jgi:hypothetical protein
LVFLWLHEQFVSCLAAAIITGDRAGNSDIAMALVALAINVLLRATFAVVQGLGLCGLMSG